MVADADDAAGPGAEPSVLETIVVTARKREEPQQDVPVAISVVGAESIAERGLDTLGDLGLLTPNFQVTDSASIRTIYIRGVGGGGRQVGFDTRAGVYVDGVYVGSPPASESLLLDLDRAEILRGPQGYLFGQNSTSGAVSLVTRAPQPGQRSQLLASAGNRDAQRVAGSANLPLSGDSLLLRISATGARRDGFTRNIITGDDVDDLNQAGGRMRLRWLPSPNLTADFAADASRQNTHIVGGEPRTNTFGTGPAEAPKPFETSNNTQERDLNQNRGVSASVNYEVADGELTTISAYRKTRRDWILDADRSSADFASLLYDDHIDFLSQELRFAGNLPAAGLHYLAGLYALGTMAESKRLVMANAGIGRAPGALGRVTPNDAAATRPDIDARSYAAFGSLDYMLNERVTLNAGLRVTRTAKDLEFSQEPETLTRIGARELLGYRDQLHETAADPTLGLQFFASEDSMLYLKYARGSKSGGFNADYLSGTRALPEQFDQETVNSYEAGFKTELWDRRLRLDAALFLADYRDYQVTQSVRQGALIIPSMTNAGRVRTYGPELSATAQPVAGLRLNLEGAWLHAEYERFKDGGGIGVDYTGNRNEYAPKVNVAASARYQRVTPWTGAAQAFIAAALSYRGSEFADASNQDKFFIAKRTLVNAQAGLAQAGGAWQVELFSENLFDEHYDDSLQTGTLGTLFGRRGTPRTYGMQVVLNW